MPTYYFGIYHWRRRFRRVIVGFLAVLLSGMLWRGGTRGRRLAAVILTLFGLSHAKPALQRMLDPPPWALKRSKYERLAADLPFQKAETALDVGTGTARSLVALAPMLPPDVRTTAVDVFDDRVILGNGPELARKNARRAGLDPHVVRGDASSLGVADDSQDVVTISRVLHDLPDEASADTALAEARRVLSEDGSLGVLEVPVTPRPCEDALAYWRDRVEAADFEILTAEWVDGYVVVQASPA